MKLSFILRPATIPLDRDATGRFLPMVVAVMVLLASLLLVGALALGDGLQGWRGSLEGHATVQILPLDDRTAPLSDRVTMALNHLKQSLLVVNASEISSDEMTQLLAPWLGQSGLSEDLPIPALIDVTLQPETTDLAALREALKSVAGASLDDHGSWLGDVRRLASWVIALAYALVALIIGAAALIIILMVRAGMTMHRDVVELLHLVGAEDDFIAWQFQRHMCIVSLQGAMAGCFVSILLLMGLDRFAHRAGLDVLAGLSPVQNVAVLALIPLGFVSLAALASGFIARRLLSELP